MTALTAGGLPYPVAADALRDTPKYIGDLAAGCEKLLGNPGLVFTRMDIVVNGADGRGWFTFATLSRVDGLVVQPNRGDLPIWPTIISRNANNALVQFRYPDMNTGSITIRNFGGTLNCNVYAWGLPK